MEIGLDEPRLKVRQGVSLRRDREWGIVIGNQLVLRFLAATGFVVLRSNAEIMSKHTGFYGVAVFFLLSGYVMGMVSDRSASTLMLDRMWRITPAYWIAMAVAVVVLRAWNSTTWPTSSCANSSSPTASSMRATSLP